MRRAVLWGVACLAVDAGPVLATGGFDHGRALPGWHGAELLILLPLAAFSLAWCGFLAANAKARLPYLLRILDWRLSAIGIATLLSIVLTLLGFYFDLQDERWKFVEDVFAAWCGGVAFFGLVGIIVSVVSLASANDETFDVRARILVRGRRGEHIDDFIERLRTTLAHYTSVVERRFVIAEYDAPSRMYLLRSQVNAEVCSYVDDIETTYASAISYRPDHPPPPGRHHRLVRVTGVSVADPRPLATAATEELRREYTAQIARGESRRLEYVLETWIRAGEECVSYSPVRYSMTTEVSIENHLDRDVTLRARWLGEQETRAVLHPGEAPLAWSRPGLKQGSRVHMFWLDPPA